MVLQIPPIVFPNNPVSNVQPFTFKDGATYLERLESLQLYISKVINPWLLENINDLTAEFQEKVNALIVSVNTLADAVINDGIELHLEVLYRH